MGLFSFLGKKKFYLHLFIAVVLTLIIIGGVSRYLESYTRHHEVYVVPDFFGKQYTEIQHDFGQRFTFIISDSIYVDQAESGSIIQQDPYPGSKVKEGRNVYLVIVAQHPEQVPMPNLRNLSLREALGLLESISLIPNQITITDHFAQNAVVEQLMDGEVIEPGTPVYKGAYIDLQVGSGGTVHKVVIPALLGKKRKEAIYLLQMSSLNLGEEYYPDGYDTTRSRVFRTEPNLVTERTVLPGTKINLYFRSETNFNFDEFTRIYQSDSLLIDSLYYHDEFIPDNNLIHEQDEDEELQ
jgi:eukaryotic-like serine/threonine-protein kinase